MFGELQFTKIHMRTEIWGPKKRRIPEKRITKTNQAAAKLTVNPENDNISQFDQELAAQFVGNSYMEDHIKPEH
jgi:poly-beta-hydroxyalkanoate depolymerase